MIYSEFIDFGIFFVLFGLLLFIIFSQSMSMLHRVYLVLHLSFMHWALLQFASKATDLMNFKFLFVQSSYLVLASISVIFYIFTIFIINKLHWFKTWRFKLSLFPAAIMLLIIAFNPNQAFILDYAGPATDKVIGYGPLFSVLPIVSLLYVALIFAILISGLRKFSFTTVTKRHIYFALNGIISIVLFAVLDFVYNIVFIDYFNHYIPFLSLGMLVSACYMTFRINHNNLLNIISLAHRDVANTMSVGILVIDRDNYIIEMNKHVYSMVSLRTGDKLDFDYIMKTFHHNEWDKILRLYEKQKHNRFAVVSYELVVSQQPYRHSLIQCHPIIDGNQVSLGYMYTVQDITELKVLIENTKQKNRLLQQRNAELLQTQEELYVANKKLEKIAITDSLTECYNRRYLIKHLEGQLPINIDQQIPFALVAIDIDFFKSINDRFGHFGGDTVLKSTAKTLMNCIDSTDILARFGGEEFIIYIHNTSKEGVNQKIKKLKEEVENNKIWLEDTDEVVSITVSVGLVSIDQFDRFEGKTSKNLQYEIMALADQALYEAKNQGRNTIVKRDYVASNK